MAAELFNLSDKCIETIDSARRDNDMCPSLCQSEGDVVSDAVLTTVEKLGCDLVVMASHGRRGIKRVLLGSETQQVLTHAKVPVLVLK